MKFAKWGWPEFIKFNLIGIAIAVVGFVWVGEWTGIEEIGVATGIAGVILVLFILNFFRDPDRPLSGGDLDIISPADGTVTDATIGEVTGEDYITGKAHVLGIFLSVFDVHVNRSPLEGKVTFLRYKQGKFLDARHKDCGKLNEQQVIGMEIPAAKNTRIEVRQIAGLIARRIICPLTEGARLLRGERFGMIKFGSRTEVWVDASQCDVEWLVKPGDKVKGGLTIVGRMKPRQ